MFISGGNDIQFFNNGQRRVNIPVEFKYVKDNSIKHVIPEFLYPGPVFLVCNDFINNFVNTINKELTIFVYMTCFIHLNIENMTIGMACDHAGYQMKNSIKEYLTKKGITVTDFGTNSDTSVDYPDYAHPLANAVEKKTVDTGIALCGTGNGINMTLNKHQGIRSALCWDVEIAKFARLHNNANVLVLPARVVNLEKALAIIEVYLNTQFEGGRHTCRIDKIPVK